MEKLNDWFDTYADNLVKENVHDKVEVIYKDEINNTVILSAEELEEFLINKSGKEILYTDNIFDNDNDNDIKKVHYKRIYNNRTNRTNIKISDLM